MKEPWEIYAAIDNQGIAHILKLGFKYVRNAL